MPVDKIGDAPPSIKELDDTELTLAQINWILNVYDGLQDDPDVDSPMAVAITQFKESYEIVAGKWKKKEAATSSVNLDEEPERVRDAFWDLYRCPDMAMTSPWVIEVFDDHIIAEDGNELFKIPYTDDGESIVFALRAEWEEVERTYTPITAIVTGFRRMWDDLGRMFGPRQKPQCSENPHAFSGGQVYLLTGDSERELRVDEDGLVWKDLLMDGRWFTLDGAPVTTTRQQIDDVHDAFTGGNLYPVPLPFNHVEHLGGDDPENNNGFVRAMKIGGADGPETEPNGDYVLWVGLDVTEPETMERLERGSIDNVSAWLEPNVHDNKEEGKVWPWVLWHVALTDKPQLDLKSFTAHVVTRERGQEEVMSQDVSLEDLQAQLEEAREQLEVANGELEAANARIEAEGSERETSDARITALEEQLRQREQEVHEQDVESILSAMQGRGSHRLVSLGGKMIPPAVLSVVQPVLEADVPGNGGRLILSVARGGDNGQEDVSVTRIVTDLVNAFGAAGVLLDTVSRGTTDHSDPSHPPTDVEKRQKALDEADEWAKEHPEVKRV